MYNSMDNMTTSKKEGSMVVISSFLDQAASATIQRMAASGAQQEEIAEASGFFVSRNPSAITLKKYAVNEEAFFLCQREG